MQRRSGGETTVEFEATKRLELMATWSNERGKRRELELS